jgi:hypothetical protein
MAFDFAKFTKKVLDAVKGKLSSKERGVLERLFDRTKKRNTVLAAGLLSALKVGGAGKKEIANLAKMLEKANDRILEGKTPFTKAEEKKLGEIFRSARVPRAAEERLRHNVQAEKDDLLVNEIVNSITTSTRAKLRGFVPEKEGVPAVSLEEEGKRAEKKKKRQKGRR